MGNKHSFWGKAHLGERGKKTHLERKKLDISTLEGRRAF